MSFEKDEIVRKVSNLKQIGKKVRFVCERWHKRTPRRIGVKQSVEIDGRERETDIERGKCRNVCECVCVCEWVLWDRERVWEKERCKNVEMCVRESEREGKRGSDWKKVGKKININIDRLGEK